MSDLLESKPKQNKKIEEEPMHQVTTLLDELKKDYRFPIDFVQYIERDYIPKLFLPKSDRVFKMNRQNDFKFNVLQFTPKTQLNQKLFRNGEEMITAISGYSDFIYIGNAKGIVKKYSCKSEIESSVFIESTINAMSYKVSVECIDISQNGNFIAIGYSNGYVSLWEMKGNTLKMIKLVDKAHRINVVTIKFISTSNSVYELLTTDNEGNVLHLKINEGFLVNTYTTSLIYREYSPTFTIDIFNPTDQQKVQFPFCRTTTVLVLFGCIEKVNLYSFSPELKKLYVFNNPAYKGVRQIPNASFGIGSEPTPRDSKGKVIKSQINHGRHCVMLAISWDDTLSVYKLFLDTLTVEDCNLCGFLNNSQILRMGFIDTSLIYIFDGMKKIKLLNTNLMNDKFEERGIKRDYDTIPLLDEGGAIFEDILYKSNIQDHSDRLSNQTKKTYNNFLMTANKTIFFITSKCVFLGSILNWDDSIKTLKENAQWDKALFLGLEIYDGNVSSLSNIPQNEAERKVQSADKIKEILEQYTSATISKIREESFLLNENCENEKVIECINMNIEICIQINQVTFLFETLLPIYEKKLLKNTFLCLLEPFILLNRFEKFPLTIETIEVINQYYAKENQYPLLTQLLTKLNFESINKDTIYDLCKDQFLFSLLIYLDCRNRKYFNPIEEMYNQYSILTELDNEPICVYNYYLKKYKLSNLLKSKTYVRHKTLWYCYFCLTGTVPQITPEEYEELIIRILNFLLKPKVFTEMLEFDSYSFFKVLSRFFIEQNLAVIISKDSNRDKITVDIENRSQNDPLLELIFAYIIKSTERMSSLLIKQDLNEFIALRATSKTIDVKTTIKSGTFLIDFYNEIQKHPPESIIDKYHCHGIKTGNHCYLKEISDILIIILDSLDNEALKVFESLSQSSPFVLVKIKILQKQLNYIECLKELIHNKNNPLLGKQTIFEWVNKTFSELSNCNEAKSTELFENFKAAFLEFLEPLALFSNDDAIKITDKWFQNEKNKVIEYLGNNKEIQFIFLEKYLKDINEDDIMTASDSCKKEYSDLLLLQIKLLIHFNRENEALPNIAKRKLYPLREVLQLCLDNNIKDASIHIYQSLGEDINALEICMKDLKIAFDKLINGSLDSNINENTFADLLNKYNSERISSIEISKTSSNSSPQNKSEALWFALLNKMYEFLNKIIKLPVSDNTTELTITVSKQIEELLKEMCNYIHIQDIIDKVTQYYQNAEYGQFKDLLTGITLKLVKLINMLDSVKYLLSHSILYNLVEFKKINGKGNSFLLNECDSCKKRFIYGDMLIAFRCGHKVHNAFPCFTEENNELICKICRKNEVDSPKLSRQGKSMIRSRLTNIKSIDETANSGQSIRDRENMFSKLKNFDKGFFEKSDLAVGTDTLFF